MMSGHRPTGRLHLGHLLGTLTNWVRLSETTDAFFEVADLHAFTTGFAHPQQIRDAREELVLDWLAAGIDPERSTVFLQSEVPEITELNTLLSMIVPVSWLQRVPTYKDQIEELGPEIATYGFLGYPLLQLCDIAVFRADTVPVGKDQVSHLEFGREVVRRFNHLYGDTLVEPQPLLSEFPAVPGSDGRKMSKSYHNTIDIADDEAATTKKVRSFITDPLKVRRNDPGRPEICPVFALHHYSNAARVPEIREACASGALGCVACKTELAETLNAFLRPARERRASIDRARVGMILREGSAKAREVANATMREVRRAMKLVD
ncbi:MAG TPA: tryptophan--tRNA ligase [Candidatus Elarobacter sp.]|nr:tryptophan--tRNA ligase [Candidatus Elarobacter sp.]